MSFSGSQSFVGRRRQNGPRPRNDTHQSNTSVVRAHTRISRFVSIEGRDNTEFERWLVESTRANPDLKNMRNIGGLSLSLVENRFLYPALRQKYEDFGRYYGATESIQRGLSQSLAAFIASVDGTEQWQKRSFKPAPRLRTLYQKDREVPISIVFDGEVLREQREQVYDFLRNDEGLKVHDPNAQPGKMYIPHISLLNAPPKVAERVRLPPMPREIILGPVGLSSTVESIRR